MTGRVLATMRMCMCVSLRGSPEEQGVPLLVSVDCREKPPGLLGIVAVVALAQMVLIWVIGAFHSFYFPAENVAKASAAVNGVNSGGATDVVAILLALPGVVVAWLSAQFSGERFRSTSIATVVGLLGCAVIAVGSTAGAVVKTAGGVFGAGIGTEHPVWLMVMVLSAVLAMDLTARVVARSLRFGARINFRVILSRRVF